MSIAVTETESTRAWAEFLRSYADGRIATDSVPLLPPLSFTDDNQPALELDPSFEDPVYTSINITPAVACRVRDFYKQHQYLAPPRAPLEALREQIIQEYDLYSDKQVGNIQAATDLVQAFFGGICTFTLFRDSVQELMAVSGPADEIQSVGLHKGLRLLPETSLCGHSVLFAGETTYIPDLASDWRYQGNPYADSVKGVKSYLGSVISLNVDPSSLSESRLVGVGVINLMHMQDFLPPLTDEQKTVMNHLRVMLETQLRATWEGQGRTREARARRAVSDFADKAVVNSSNFGQHAQEGLELIRGVMEEVDCAVVVDLQCLHPVKDQAGSHFALNVEHQHPFRTLAFYSTAAPCFLASSSPVFTSFLQTHSASSPQLAVETFHIASQYTSAVVSGFEPFLIPSSHAHTAIPFFLGAQPLFLILLSTSRPFTFFRSSDTAFLRSMGKVLCAHVSQSRVLEADAAKTAFLSSISHELRTPMHVLLSGMELIRHAVESKDWDQANDLLGMTETSGLALQQILNDVLDFGFMEQGSETTANRSGEQAKRPIVDLSTIVLDSVKACAQRMQTVDEGGKVQLVANIEDRDWRARIDEPGFRRLLLNGLTNAVKFTSAGNITLTLVSGANNQTIRCRIVDTGPGIHPKFLPRLFEPFTKADSFTPGAGLGLYITKTLVQRMGGQVQLSSLPQGGTAFELDLPLELMGDKPKTETLSTRVVSNPHTGRSSKAASDSGSASSRWRSVEMGLSSSSSSRSGSAPRSVVVHPPPDPDVTIPLPPLARSGSPPSSTDPNLLSGSFPSSSAPAPLDFVRPLRILLADDNDISRRILFTLLTQISRRDGLQMQTAQAVDGQEALEMFGTFGPDLVITDVSMPRMDGIQAASEMRRLEKEAGEGQTKQIGQDGMEGPHGGPRATPPAPGRRRRCKIYAMTGLGSTDPRLKTDALRGTAELDGWLIKGKDQLSRVQEIIKEASISLVNEPR